ncbi:MAG TPA: DUF4147 domain-containing protein [Blastocatellia bacterium]|nr:DUF4147 domain-containing protein [Blastocatellia bacterium]
MTNVGGWPALRLRDPGLEAVQIYLETLKRIDLSRVIKEKIRLDREILSIDGEEIDLREFSEVVIIGLGKASIRMATAVCAILEERITRGVLVTDRLINTRFCDDVQVLVGGHPLPDENSLRAGRLILEAIESSTKDTLLIFLISGGGSALAEQLSPDGLSLEDLSLLNRLLVGSGATIGEINAVRKQLSRIKGGKAGYLARKSRVVALFVSDVNPADLRTLASNPILPDQSSSEDPHRILDRYGLTERLPARVIDSLTKGVRESPGDWTFENGFTALLLEDNESALGTAAEVAAERGFNTEICFDLVEGDYREISREISRRVEALKRRTSGPVCVISGGEVVCPVKGTGAGGRNQEFVLYSAAPLAGQALLNGAVFFSAGSDGIDGSSVAAGAVTSHEVMQDAATRGYDPSVYIQRSDSNTFFFEAGGLLVTGPTGNNVRDIRIAIVA